MRTEIRTVVYFAVGLLMLVVLPGNIFSWGFFGHKKINRMAVFTLPPEMIGFYKKHIEFITEHSVDPDRRRYAVKEEAPRHYIDLELYGEYPFDSVPRWWKKAVAKYTEDTLMSRGILPWYIERAVFRLTEAFKEMNGEKIIKNSADLGHYIADAHVPLHTTHNYNGQMTGQHGIHGFWESRLPELFSGSYDFFTGRARYIERVGDFAWETVLESFLQKDSVLIMDAELHKNFPSDLKFSFETRGASTVKVYSEEYSKKYHMMLNTMVERRMKSAILATGSLWYTAWVNAGQPDLKLLYDKEWSEQFWEEIKQQEKMWEKGTLKVRDHTD